MKALLGNIFTPVQLLWLWQCPTDTRELTRKFVKREISASSHVITKRDPAAGNVIFFVLCAFINVFILLVRKRDGDEGECRFFKLLY
jgi:hypothetical protein